MKKIWQKSINRNDAEVIIKNGGKLAYSSIDGVWYLADNNNELHHINELIKNWLRVRYQKRLAVITI